VIAAAYSDGTKLTALAAAGGGLGLCFALNRAGVRAVGIYLLVGAGVWLATLASGVHPTIAGVALGLLTPAAAWVGPAELVAALNSALGRVQSSGGADRDDLEHLEEAARESSPPLERLEHGLHPWVGYVVMPVFALANAGVEIRLGGLTHPVAVAVALGLAVGKPVGIVGACFLAVRLKLAERPSGVGWLALVGAGCLGGIGFTMSLFVAGLAFSSDAALLDAAKVGILLGSGVSAVLGCGLLLVGLPKKI
jgi:NhaA family Na+:H+ antiporter